LFYKRFQNNKLELPPTISKNKIITIGKQKYNIQAIEVSGEYGYTLYTYRLTKSYYFIMPSLGATSIVFRGNQELCNCFIGIEGNELYGDTIYLLYRFNGSKEFMEYERRLMEHPMYKSTWHPDNFHIMYEFYLPDKHKEDINKILEGKYSYVTPSYKEKIIHFHGGEFNSGTKELTEILYRDPKRKSKIENKLTVTTPLIIPNGLDLLSVPSVENEIYLNRYKIPKEDKKENDFELN